MSDHDHFSDKIKVDAFIIGGGLAGIHLALSMIRKGLVPLVIDEASPVSSSRVAAGIINPVTGRRFAFTWMYEVLQPVFTEVYKYWEKEWQTSFFDEVSIFRSVPQNTLVNNLDARLADGKYEPYCREMTVAEIESVRKKMKFEVPGYVFRGYHLDTTTFLDKGIEFLKRRNCYLRQKFEVPETITEGQLFETAGFMADKIIFCTGAAISENSYFDWVHMNPNKGEALLLHMDEWSCGDMIKQEIFYVPQKNGQIWAGSYNSWEFSDENPSSEGCSYLVDQVKDQLAAPWTLIDHIAAVRPAVEDRRPVIGSHPLYPAIRLFNGFGSKGSSLIPYFASELRDSIWSEKKLSPRVDVRRFWEN